MRVYLDTNILIDFVCKREPFYEDAKSLFALGSIGQIEMVMSALSVVNAVYIGKKYELPVVKKRIKSILPFVSVCNLQTNVVIKALDAEWKDYEDFVQCMSAVEVFADCIVTRNKKDFSNSSMPVYTIDELLGIYNGLY